MAPLRTHSAKGFTLLEVIMALAITGFVLGSLFSLVGGSKQLSWRAEESLLRSTHLRAATNFALLEDEYEDLEPILENPSFLSRPLDVLEEPERKTQATEYALQEFEVIDTERDTTVVGSRWVRFELPQ